MLLRLLALFALPALALASSACCYAPGGSSATPPAPTSVAPPPAAPTVATPTTMLSLPTSPPPSFAGVTGPMPVPGMPFGMPGAITRAGTATVTASSGSLPLPIGSACAYVQWRIDPAEHRFDCRWNVTCSGFILYGAGTGGYEYCTRPEWPPGTIMADDGTESVNGDPLFRWDAAGMSLGDDPSGDLGAWAVTLRPTP